MDWHALYDLALISFGMFLILVAWVDITILDEFLAVFIMCPLLIITGTFLIVAALYDIALSRLEKRWKEN